ncbi:MAG: rhomboid family intramembrane serine protease, partial [Pseudomonadales bacterium]|nr:rhomboid family intramembrane serine protease [Pseudomonadales bacterium]
MELIRTPQPELADLIERTLTRNGFQVERHEADEQCVLVIPDPGQYPHARQLTEELIADLKRGQGRQPLEPLTGQPQPLLSGGWLASMGWVTKTGLVLCVAIFLTPYLIGDGVYRALLFPSSLEGLASQPWRLITPMLLHFSILHIIFNLLW